MEELFLIRTIDAEILGPFSKQGIIERFRLSELQHNDEIGVPTNMWFLVANLECWKKYFGDPPQLFFSSSATKTLVRLDESVDVDTRVDFVYHSGKTQKKGRLFWFTLWGFCWLMVIVLGFVCSILYL